MSGVWSGGSYAVRIPRNLGPRRAQRDCNVADLAAECRVEPDHRGMNLDDSTFGEGKIEARRLIKDLLGPDRHPGYLKVLTMPGRNWRFESSLLRRRETTDLRGNWDGLHGPLRTEFHCVDNDRASFYNAALCVPGMRHPLNTIVDLGNTSYAERVLEYLWIRRHALTDVDSYMRDRVDTYDAAWLDYTGPLSPERMRTVLSFFETSVRSTIAVTALRGRGPRSAAADARRQGSYEGWVRSAFDGYRIEHYVEYCDTSPMMQFAVSKETIS